MNRCAFPECSTPIVMTASGTIVGEVCHIRAQSALGPRYDSNQSDEERHGFENLVLMCRVHHKVIDAPENVGKYTVAALVEIKHSHEAEARELGQVPDAPPNIIAALVLTATVYESGSVHMNFSNTVFRVGGEGGLLAGGGGNGGVLKIVGIQSLPPSVAEQVHIDLRGQDGRASGAGGGGAGVLIFEGREVTEEDIVNGLKVPLFFAATSIEHTTNGLMYALGIGWTHCGVPYLPRHIRVGIGVMFEVGTIEQNTLLRFEITAQNPSGAEQVLGAVDAPVPVSGSLVARSCASAMLEFDADELGVYELGLRSGGIHLASYPVEIKLGA